LPEPDSQRPEEDQDEGDPTEPRQATDSGDDAEPSPDSELAEALREKEQFKRLAQRAQADLVNYRRRVE
jgi:molecular chaperone GrpE (heat shock protein)